MVGLWVLDTTTELGQVLAHIGSTIDTVMSEIAGLRDRPDKHVTLYGPFLGRTVLEQSLTALIARFDPFRVLLIKEMQRSPEYQPGVRLKSAIQWQGDIVSSKSKGAPANLWSPEKSGDEITRAAGDYFEHIIWRPAFGVLLDSPDPLPSGPWTQELQLMLPEGLVPRFRNEVVAVYSALSKGIHHEFVIPPESSYDRRTIATCLLDTIRLASHLGLLSQMVAHCPFPIARREAFGHYNNLQYCEVQ